MTKLRPGDPGLDLPMDPMVDVVFQLLIFFLFTFQVRLLEVVLRLEVVEEKPAAVRAADQPGPVRLDLAAGPGGGLGAVTLDGKALAGLGQLSAELAAQARERPDDDHRVLLWAAEALQFEHVVEAARLVSRDGWRVQLGQRPEPAAGGKK